MVSSAETDHSLARDILATQLTRTRGEFILRLGTHPAHSKLFDLSAHAPKGTEFKESEDKEMGEPLTAEELTKVIQTLKSVAEELGAKVSLVVNLFFLLPRADNLLAVDHTIICQ